MLRLRCSIITQILSPPPRPTDPFSSASSPRPSPRTPAVSPNPAFAVDDYLVQTCGLTRPQALKVSSKLSHLKSPAKPDAVLAFIAGLGLSGAEVAAVVAKDPKFLCTSVEKTMSPAVAGLTGLGLSRSEIVRLVLVLGANFRHRTIISSLRYYLPIFGSSKSLLRTLRSSSCLVSADLDRVVKPNVAFLQHEYGLGACDIAKLFARAPRVLTANPERVPAMVAYAEGIGVPRGSRMFWLALRAVQTLSVEKISAKVEYLKSTFRWSDAEVGIAVCKAPMVLRLSEDLLQTKPEFLFSEVGLEPAYIARRPALLSYSLEGRLRPWYHLVKFLKANGLLEHDFSFFSIAQKSEKVFMGKFRCPHKEAAPHLSEDYAAARRGEAPARFISA